MRWAELRPVCAGPRRWLTISGIYANRSGELPGGEGAGSVSSLNNLFVAISWSRFGSGEKKQAEQKPNAVVEVGREGGPTRRWPWRWVGGGA